MNDYERDWRAAQAHFRSRGWDSPTALKWRMLNPDKTPTEFWQMTSDYEARDRLVKKYAWAIPNQEALEAVAALGPIVEVGAGRGYWASLLSDMGVDIVAYDLLPPDIAHNGYVVGRKEDYVVPYHPVTCSDELVGAQHPDRALLIIWPCYDERWAYDAVHAYHAAGGRTVIFVGEGWGGCTADETFFQYLSHYGNSPDRIYLPQWNGIHDGMEIYRLKAFDDSFVPQRRCSKCYDHFPEHSFQFVSESHGWEKSKYHPKGRYEISTREWCLDCYQEWIIQHLLPANCG